MHRMNHLPVIYWDTATYRYCGDVQNEDPSEAAMRLLFSVKPDAFIWTQHAPMPPRLREAFATDLIGSGRNGYQVRLMVRRPTPVHK